MDFGVYSLVDVLVCKDSENRAKCKINRDLFSFLMEHQGQVGVFLKFFCTREGNGLEKLTKEERNC